MEAVLSLCVQSNFRFLFVFILFLKVREKERFLLSAGSLAGLDQAKKNLCGSLMQVTGLQVLGPPSVASQGAHWQEQSNPDSNQ